jgi:hypothetical protein
MEQINVCIINKALIINALFNLKNWHDNCFNIINQNTGGII